MNKELIKQFAHLYNEAKHNVMKRNTGGSLAPLALRYDKEDLIEIMEEFLTLLDVNGFYIQKKPETLKGEFEHDYIPRGKLLD